jgi:hypothetical protein
VKILTSTLLIIFASLIACAQSEVSQKPASVEIVKFTWSKERIDWERDPFGGPVENFDEMRSRARNEKRIDDAKRGGGGAGADRAKRDANADAANLARQREKSPPRYVFVYKAKVRNMGTAAITAIDWDYIFYERGTENEIGRQQFTSEEPIGAGKTRELIVRLSSPPTHTISVTALNIEEREALSEKVIVVRIKYADGSVWPAP